MRLFLPLFPPVFSLLALICALSACGNSNGTGTGIPLERLAINAPFKVLVFSRTVGFRHASIPVGIQTIQMLGAANNFGVDASEDPTVFNSANLAQYQVVIFLNTTLNVLDTPAQEAALVAHMQRGGGFVGVHGAADTEHGWPYYGELVGAYFRSHPVQQLATLRSEAPDHPSTAHYSASQQHFDEFYSFKTNPRGTVRVLLNLDESSYRQNPNTSCIPDSPTFPNGFNGVMGDHPISWCHTNKGGVAWYTGLGHEPATYAQTAFQTHLLNGILTAAGRLPADCRPKEGAAASQPDPALKMCPVS
jgi:hypothetical protein